MTADLNFFQNAEKSDCANAFENDNRTKTTANQAGVLIMPIKTNEFSFAFTVAYYMYSFR